MGVFQNHLMGAAAAAASASTDFYDHQIANSVRMQMGAGSRLRRTPSSAGNRQTWAISMWVKRCKLGDEQFLYEAGASGDQDGRLRLVFTDADKIMVGTGNANLATSSAVFRDTSSWYHIHWKNTGGTNTVHVNGLEVISVSCSGDTAVNNTVAQGIGCRGGSGDDTTSSLEGYIAEFLLFDGTAYSYTDVTDDKNGVLIPADPSGLTFGTNGTWLKFESDSDLGNDSSGNNNDWTESNLATHDQMTDTPTFNSSSNGGNFCTIGGLEKNTGGFTFSEGNLKYAVSTNNRGFIFSQGVPESGKYYWEVRATAFGGTQDQLFIGVCQPDKMRGNLTAGRGGGEVSGAGGYTFDQYNGAAWLDGVKQSNDSIGTSRSAPQTFGFAIDRDNNTLKWTYDGSSYSSTYTIPSSGPLYPYIGSGGGSNTASGVFNFGADSTFAGLVTAGGNADGNGYGNFSLAVPSGYVALCAGNLPTPATDPEEEEGPYKYFVPKLYTGDGASTLAITGLEFQPDFTWIKNRDQTDVHNLYNSTLGVTKYLQIDNNAALTTDADTLKSFTSDGFTVGADVITNTSGEKYVSWNWKATGGTTATNNDGNVETTIQADSDRGFSIIKWTGTGSNSRTLGHGLTKEPEVFLVKRTENTQSWNMWHSWANNGSEPGTHGFFSPESSGAYSAGSGGLTYWYPTGFGSSTVGVGGASGNNNSGEVMIGWAWHSVDGFSKFSGYEGNGNANGTFVYLGFRPAMIWIKSTSSTGNWLIFDDQREGYNVDNDQLISDDTTAEATSDMIDMLSNGFKCRISTYPNVAETYAYLAWAENPFKYATAR